ncbi:MAG: DOMON domain-containing protein [Geminicoccaceae bacterium]
MRRRIFLACTLFGLTATRVAADQRGRRIERNGTIFAWRHRGDRLHGNLSAPTRGWIAVGFNDEPTLKGTRFLIGSLGDDKVRAEMHIADPPHHQPVEALGGFSDIGDLQGQRENDRTRIAFSLPHRSTDRFAVDLMPGRSIHLMLAWSHEPDFAHHSAWRRHVDVIL